MPRPAAVVALWSFAAAAFSGVGVAWLHGRVPPDPLATLASPLLLPAPPDAPEVQVPPTLEGARRAEASLVVTSTPAATEGFRLRVTGSTNRVSLSTTSGERLRQWDIDRHLFDDSDTGFPSHGEVRDALLRDDGGLFALVDGVGVVSLDPDGSIAWTAVPTAHDHFERLPSGRIRVLAAPMRPIFGVSRTRVYPVDQLLDLAVETGAVKRRIDLVEALEAGGVEFRSADMASPTFAVWFDVRPEKPAFVALRYRGTLAEIGTKSKRLLREHTGPWRVSGPFASDDEGGWFVLEHEPEGPARVHHQRADGSASVVAEWDDPFRIEGPGGLYRLPNGHLLVYTGTASRELDGDGAVVWSETGDPERPATIVAARWLPPHCCAFLEAP